MRSSVFIAFDTETTGLYPGFDQVVEIAACRFKNGEVIDTFETLVNPGREIPPEITAIHGITDEMVSDAPSRTSPLAISLNISAPIPSSLITPRSTKGSFRSTATNTISRLQNNPVYDTLLMSRRLFPELRSHGLASLTGVFQIPHEVKHRGLPDVMEPAGFSRTAWIDSASAM